MGKRKVPGINASSTADISFILLIFFLVTTSMDTDRGLQVRLPQPPDETQLQDPPKIRKRNSLVVNVNMNNEILITQGEKVPYVIPVRGPPMASRARQGRAYVLHRHIS